MKRTKTSEILNHLFKNSSELMLKQWRSSSCLVTDLLPWSCTFTTQIHNKLASSDNRRQTVSQCHLTDWRSRSGCSRRASLRIPRGALFSIMTKRALSLKSSP